MDLRHKQTEPDAESNLTGVRLKLDVQGQGGRKISDIDGQGDKGVLKIRQFSWTSYVYHPLLLLFCWSCLPYFLQKENQSKILKTKY